MAKLKKLVYRVPMAPLFALGFVAALVILPLKVGYRFGARVLLSVLDWAKA